MLKNNILMINSSARDGGAAMVVNILRQKLETLGIETSLGVKKIFKISDGDFELRRKSRLMTVLTKIVNREDGELHVSDKIHELMANDVEYFNNRSFFNSNEYRIANVVHLHNLHGLYFNLENIVRMSREKKVVWTLHDMWAITGHCCHSFECERWKFGCGSCPHLSVYQSLLWDNSHGLWKKKKEIYTNMNLNIVCPSYWLANKLKKSILKEQAINIIPNGVDTKIFKPTDKKRMKKILGLDENRKLILFVAQGGKENIWKGGDYLNQLFFDLKEDKSWQWLVVGGNRNWRRDNYREIKYVDSQELLAKYYSAADIFLYPTLADNCPLVVLESMSSGVPVVTFDTGGMSEIVDHMINGYVAKYKDIYDLKKGMMMMMGNNVLLSKYSVESRKKILKSFDLDFIVKRYIGLYGI